MIRSGRTKIEVARYRERWKGYDYSDDNDDDLVVLVIPAVEDHSGVDLPRFSKSHDPGLA